MNDQLRNFVITLRSMFTGRRTEQGASAVEYGLLVAGIAAVIVAIVFLLGGTIKKSFDDTCAHINGGSSGVAATCS